MKLCKILSSAILMAISCYAYAAQDNIHTWHTVSSTDGVWDARLQMINQNGFFQAPGGSTLSTFSVSPSKPQDYGFGFVNGSTFDIAYTLTLTKRDPNTRFSSKACVYVITASGPAKPDIRVSAFNGATCNWHVVEGRGEDFTVA